MAATKQRSWLGALRGAWSALTQPGSRLLPTAVGMSLTLMVMLAGGLMAWRVWGHQVVAQPKFRLSARSLVVPPQPAWVQGDIRMEVIRDGSLAGASTLQPDLAIRVARAFEVHSWVAKVRRVSKHYPDRVIVDLDYRRPVAMVEVDRHVFAVDMQSVVLPSNYFLEHPEEVRLYPRIVVSEVGPIGPEGSAWGDPRVSGAARIAALLVDAWPRLGLYRIAVQENRGTPVRAAEPVYVLMTKNFGRVIWGRAAGKESHGEPPATAKVAALLAYVESHGPLEARSADFLLDLRERRPLSLPPQPVRKRNASATAASRAEPTPASAPQE